MDAEHRIIESVVKALGGVADDMERGRHADVAMLVTAVEFLRVYADKLHHGKEETLFFPMLARFTERGTEDFQSRQPMAVAPRTSPTLRGILKCQRHQPYSRP